MESEVLEIAERAKGRDLTWDEANKIIRYCFSIRKSSGSCESCVLSQRLLRGKGCPVVVEVAFVEAELFVEEPGESDEQKGDE